MMTAPHSPDENILDRLWAHCQTQPDRLAYRFLRQDGNADTRTFAELDRRVRGLAAQLRERAAPGERALLLYPPGLEFIDAFLACLAAGIIAVPAYPPRRNRKAERLRAIAEDAQPRLLLTTRQLLPTLNTSELGDVRGLVGLATGDLSGEADTHGSLPNISGDATALIQYTSGSTGSPRGVVVTHQNLTANELAIQAAFRHTRDSVCVNWLPVFHDMGLIGNVLQPLFVGFPSILLAPTSFLQEPVRWLRAITEYRGTTAGAPNFAYDHCVRNITEEQKQGLDLHSWTVAYNGAEPVRADTLDRFTESFAACGFRRTAFFPCYGLAEATLFVSGEPSGKELRRRCVEACSLEAGNIEAAGPSGGRWLVGSGRCAEGTKVVAVDPASRREVPTGRVGELWVSSPAVAASYWGRVDDARLTFNNHLANGDGPFLNTGDLGFVDNDEVFVTGRSKDLIIIRGRNIYPQDVEAAVERVLPFIEANSCAAFAVDDNGRERLGLVVEADRELVRIARTAVEGNGKAEAAAAELALAVGKVRQAVGDDFEVPVHTIAFVKPGAFPRTSSGKIQRRACRDRMLRGTLELIHAWREPTDFRDAIHQAVVRRLRAEVDPGIEAIDYDTPLTAQGLDSMSAAAVAATVEKATGVHLRPELVYEHATINRLAEYLARTSATVRQDATLMSAEQRVLVSDALDGSMAEFANPIGSALAERVAPYHAWKRLRREAGVWPFYRVARSPAAPNTSVSIDDGTSRQCINFASQDYLGLARDPRVLRQARQAIEEYGVHSAGSPVLLGTTVPMADLERTLAAALETDDCLVFPTGWAAGFGVISGLVRAHDTLVLDALCHRCLMEGAYRVSREPLLFRHNDLDHLRQTA